MKVIRSTNSSIESDLPTRSARSSRWMSTFVKDASDVFSVFIQFQGTENKKAVRSLSEANRGAVASWKSNTRLASPASARWAKRSFAGDRKSTRLNSSHVASSYAVFCLKKKIRWTS